MKNNVFKILSILLTVVVIGLVVFIVVISGDKDEQVVVSDEDSKVVNVSDSNDDENNSSYYDQIGEYIFKMEKFLKHTYDIVQNEEINEFNQEQYLTKTNRFILYSEEFTATPVTKEDIILHNEFLDMKYDMEQIAEYTLSYIHKQDKVSKSFHKDYYDKLLVHLNTLKHIEQEYY